jgi:glycosyltransferase involved in cell wall biosynthesis
VGETELAPTSAIDTEAEAVFVFGSIAMERGGVTRTILARMRLYADSGIKVRLLLAAHASSEDAEEAAIRKAWGLPDSVEIRYFWREAAPTGGGAEPDPLAHAVDEPGLTSFTETEGRQGALVRLYDDGVLVKTKNFNQDGQLFRIDHHDVARRVVSREYFDPHGRLVRADGVNPDTGQAMIRRWFDRSGKCWLTSWLNKSGHAQATVRHEPTPVAYDNYGQCVAEWVDKVLAKSVAPVVFSDTRNQDLVLLALAHPGARKAAVLHNGHTTKPYRAEDATKSNWLPLMSQLDAVDAVVALTNQQRADITQRYGGDNLTVINHPTPPSPDIQATREPGLLVAVARLEPQKRLEHAIRAFAIAAQKVPEARFDIYGSGGQANALKSLVKELAIGGRVQFRGFTDRPLEVFARASATVLSSWFEGFPLVLNEAMGVGTPFVAYDINYGPAEVIRHEVDGLIVPYGDIEALADAMARVLGNPGYARQLGERAREVTHRFSAQRWKREWTELFGRLAFSPGNTSEHDHAGEAGAPAGTR